MTRPSAPTTRPSTPTTDERTTATSPPTGTPGAPLRLLVLIDALRLGGAESLLAMLGSVAPQAGLDLEVVSLHRKADHLSQTAELLESFGIHPRYLDLHRLAQPAAIPTLVREIRRSDCDIVHAHLGMAIALGVPAARIARRPVVSTFHHVIGPTDRRAGWRERLAVEAATRGDRTIFVSEASRRSFTERYRPRRTPAGWCVVHNGVDTVHYRPAPGRSWAELGVPVGGSGPVVALVAALRAFKGILVAVRAWPAVLRRHPDATLLVVGDGELRAEAEAEARRLGLGTSVVFTGMRFDIDEIMRAADVVVLPSLSGENLPTVLMEAGACGKPVVSTDVGGIPDIVDDGRTGLLVRPGSSGELADATNRLLADAALRAAMGGAARARIVERFDAVLWARQLRRLYEQVLQPTTKGGAR